MVRTPDFSTRGGSPSGGQSDNQIMYYLYILQSNKKKNWHYIGTTSSLKKRLAQHNRGKVKSTKGYRPFTLSYVEKYENKTFARKRELELKNNNKKRELLFKQIYGAFV